MIYHGVQARSDATSASFGTFAFEDPVMRVVAWFEKKAIEHADSNRDWKMWVKLLGELFYAGANDAADDGSHTQRRYVKSSR